MENLLLLLQFNPQVPYGHLLSTTAWIVVSLGVLLFVLRSIRLGGLATRRTGIGIIALLLSTPVTYANLTIPDAVDFNPNFTAADLVGNWKMEGSQLQLESDGTANFRLEPKFSTRSGLGNGKGIWKKISDGNISAANTPPLTGKALLRIIRHRREIRIIIEDTDTPQLWDGDLGFRKQ